MTPLSIMKTLLISLLLLFSLKSGNAADFELQEMIQKEENYRKTSMLVLGTWSLGNIASGFLVSSQTSGSASYFHQMNGIWNLFNFGIAGFGYYSSLHLNDKIHTLQDLQVSQNTLRRVLLFNAGLDLAYIAIGWGLTQKAPSAGNPDLWNGYGQSLILQGGFLLAFDLTVYLVGVSLENQTRNLLSHLQISPNRIALSIAF